jgi:hypothetical protein
MKVSVERTHVGSYASVVQMTPRAELALALGKTDLDKLVKESTYAQVIEMLKTVTHVS